MLQFPALQTGYRYNAGRVYRNFNVGEGCDTPSENAYAPLPGAEVYRGKRKNAGVSGRILALSDDCGYYVINGIPVYDPSGNPVPTTGSPEIPVNTYNAVDPRTGSCSETEYIIPANHVNKNTDYWIWIKTKVNIFDPALKAPRLRVDLRDATGKARTIWHKGETAKLHIDQGTDSVPVTKLTLKGGVEQSISNPSFPLDLPVTFANEGNWQVSIEGWSAAIVSTGILNCEVLVTPYTDLGPSKPGVKPYLVAYSPEPDEKRDPMNKVSPSEKVVLTFSEPVKIVGKSAFLMEKQDPATGSWEKLDCQVLADGIEVTEDKLFALVWMVPSQRWPLGVKIRIRVADASAIVDQDKEFMLPFTWLFTVRGAEEIGATASGALLSMVAHKGNLYAVEKLGESLLDPSWDAPGYPVCGIRVFDVSSPDQPKSGVLFGGHGSVYPVLDPVYSGFEVKRPDMALKDGLGHEISVEPFYLHRIIQIRKAEGISLNGKARDLLLVATAPRVPCQGSAILAPTNTTGASQYLTNSTLWAFDITGDADSLDINQAPKLLMSTSIGKTTTPISLYGLPAGLGSAGGALGVIWRNAGMKILDGKVWREDFKNDAIAAGGEPQLARISRKYQGYYPPNATIATNDISRAHGVAPVLPMVLHSVISGDDEGKPVGFASLGLTGKLVHIDPKVGTGEAVVVYNPAPGQDLDSRITDFSASVDNERVLRVETLRGSWQSSTGNYQGLLLLVATDKHFWVFKCTWENKAFALKALAKAKLQDLSQDQNAPWNNANIQTDPEKMLVGVKTGGKGCVFDLKKLDYANGTVATLFPIHEIKGNNAWILNKGFLWTGEWNAPLGRLVASNLDGVTIIPKLGIPLLVDANQFFAGAFYTYNKSVLGDLNPPPLPQMPEKLIYALTDMQGRNGGYPALRHHYPDLGEMHISGVVNLQNPKEFLDATAQDSKWFMEADAKLYNGDTEVPNAMVIEGLNLSADQKIVTPNGKKQSQIFGNGDPAKVELSLKGKESDFAVWQNKFAYSPFRFFIKPETLQSLDMEMRQDFKERFRIQVQLKLYKDETQRAQEKPEATLKTYEFAVKFNSNTRLFDVIRGGVWYFDPVVASKGPDDTSQNPFTAQWLKTLVDAKGNPIDYADIFKTRLSLTPGTLFKKGESFNGLVFGDDMVVHKQDSLAWVGLDVVQQILDNAMPKMRRQLFKDDPRHRMTPLAQRFRKLFEETPRDSKDCLDTARAADALGAYGYRMAHAVNAVQAFTKEEVGVDRTLDHPDPDIWGKDPTLQNSDKDPENRPLLSRIAPLLNQRLKTGLYPINTILTRDLVFGPVGYSSKGFEWQRDAIDNCIRSFNSLPSPWGPGNESSLKANVPQLSDQLSNALISQRIITNTSQPWPSGEYFNSGLGILQLGLQEMWVPVPPSDTTPSKPPTDNTHLYFWAERPQSMDYEKDSGFNIHMQNGILDKLLGHLDAKRIDIYINGVNNTIEEVEQAANGLQKKLDSLESLDGEAQNSQVRTPVIAIYNASAKKYFGGSTEYDVLDLGECVRMKRDTADPTTRTEHMDAVRLIGILRGTAQVLWGKPFTVAYIKHHMGRGLTFEAARNKLQMLRQNMTLHAHSQGALIAAIAQTRLGNVTPELPIVEGWIFPDEDSKPITVANVFKIVTYGGAGNMLDWGADKYYKSYVHHVNDKDFVAWLVGMGDPFQEKMSIAAPTLKKGILSEWILSPLGMIGLKHLGKSSVMSALIGDPFNPHISKVISGPSEAILNTWKSGSHLVIKHASDKQLPNTADHTFTTSYLCSVGKEKNATKYPREFPTSIPVPPTDLRWFWLYLNPNLLRGEKVCPSLYFE